MVIVITFIQLFPLTDDLPKKGTHMLVLFHFLAIFYLLYVLQARVRSQKNRRIMDSNSLNIALLGDP